MPRPPSLTPDPVGLTTSTARAVLGTSDALARADRVAERLARAIELGLILDGERLPPEAQLADELGTATVTLREALATLRAHGLVETRRGRGGGTYVRHTDPDDHALSERLAGWTVVALRELGDHRRAISGTCAALAAERGLEPDVARLHQRIGILERATTASDRRRAATQLSLEVAAAAQSSTLTREELALHSRLGDLLWWRSDEEHHALVVGLWGRLASAVGRGAAGEAREVAEALVHREGERLVALRMTLYGAVS